MKLEKSENVSVPESNLAVKAVDFIELSKIPRKHIIKLVKKPEHSEITTFDESSHRPAANLIANHLEKFFPGIETLSLDSSSSNAVLNNESEIQMELLSLSSSNNRLGPELKRRASAAPPTVRHRNARSTSLGKFSIDRSLLQASCDRREPSLLKAAFNRLIPDDLQQSPTNNSLSDDEKLTHDNSSKLTHENSSISSVFLSTMKDLVRVAADLNPQRVPTRASSRSVTRRRVDTIMRKDKEIAAIVDEGSYEETTVSSSGGCTTSGTAHMDHKRNISTNESIGSKSTVQKPLLWYQGDLIGQGAFGKVYLGLNFETWELMAVKQVVIKDWQQKKYRPADDLAPDEAILKEIELLKTLDHVNIVKYLGKRFQCFHDRM